MSVVVLSSDLAVALQQRQITTDYESIQILFLGGFVSECHPFMEIEARSMRLELQADQGQGRMQNGTFRLLTRQRKEGRKQARFLVNQTLEVRVPTSRVKPSLSTRQNGF